MSQKSTMKRVRRDSRALSSIERLLSINIRLYLTVCTYVFCQVFRSLDKSWRQIQATFHERELWEHDRSQWSMNNHGTQISSILHSSAFSLPLSRSFHWCWMHQCSQRLCMSHIVRPSAPDTDLPEIPDTSTSTRHYKTHTSLRCSMLDRLLVVSPALQCDESIW
jgi:hypothetical protein